MKRHRCSVCGESGGAEFFVYRGKIYCGDCRPAGAESSERLWTEATCPDCGTRMIEPGPSADRVQCPTCYQWVG